MVLNVLQDEPMRIFVVYIEAEDRNMLWSLVKVTADDALTGDIVPMAIHAVMADAMTQGTVVEALDRALNDHGG